MPIRPDIHAYFCYIIQIRWRTVDPDMDAYSNDQCVYAFGSWSDWTDVPVWSYAGHNGNGLAWDMIERPGRLPQNRRGARSLHLARATDLALPLGSHPIVKYGTREKTIIK
jgi:hypothetical protein